jgi:hypothetical protein
LSPDQQTVLEMAGDDQALIDELKYLFELLEKHPTYAYRPFPFATKNRCHRWAGESYLDILRAKGKTGGGHFQNIRFEHWVPKYIGFIPTFEDHSVLIVTLPNGNKFYLDNYLEGGSDHIFFKIPWSLVDKDSQEYANFVSDRAAVGNCLSVRGSW